jgi:hypothetical protein
MQGDSFHFAFPYARDAVAAAVAGQRALHDHEWESRRVKVRIGIHTGEPMRADGLYAGLDVHRAARVMSVAHGSQTVISARTADLVEGELPADAALQELGEYELKDFDAPQRLFGVVAPDLPAQFPPLRANRTDTTRGRRRRTKLLVAAVALVAAIGLAAVVATRSDEAPLRAPPNSVAVVDPAENEVVSVIPVGTTPTTIVGGGDSLWTLNTGDQTVSHIDAGARAVTRTIAAGTVASDIAFADGAIWVADAAANTVSVLDESGGLETTIALDIPHRRRAFTSPRVVLASAGERVWATGGDLTTVLIDAPSRRVLRRIAGFPNVNSDASPAGPDIAIGKAGVWATDGRDEVFRVDPPPTESVQLGGLGGDEGIAGLAVDDAVWATAGRMTWQVSPRLPRPVRTVAVGQGAAGVAVGGGSVWVASALDRTLSRIEIESGRTTSIEVGGTPRDVVFANGLVWVTID